MRQNERKRLIYILRREYLDDFVEEFFSLVSYLPNDELEVDIFGKETKTTFRTVQEIFKPTKKEYTTEIGKTPSITFLAQQQLTSRVYTPGTGSTVNGTNVASTLSPFDSAGAFTGDLQ